MARKRGRPIGSEVRQRLVNILSTIRKAYGYQLHKIYQEIYGDTTRENVYYHLRKGVKLGEFELTEVKQETGNYSWGATVEKKYYTLGPNAKPEPDPRIEEYAKKHQTNRNRKGAQGE